MSLPGQDSGFVGGKKRREAYIYACGPKDAY